MRFHASSNRAGNGIFPKRIAIPGEGLRRQGLLTAVSFLAVAAQPSAFADPMFLDVTTAANINFVGDYGATLGGLTGTPELDLRNMGNGAAVGDYDNDGDLDLYLLGQLGLSNKLLRNDLDLGSKSFTDVTAAAGVDDLGLGRVAFFVDLNNDGLLDLLLINDDDGSGTVPPSKVFRNDENGSFTDVTAGSNFNPIGFLNCGAALADYDQDGLLDVYVTVWAHVLGTPVFPGNNRLYRNLGNFVFEDVSVSVGLGTLVTNCFGAIFFDFTDNGFPDMYLAVDTFSDVFYQNNAGTFVNETLTVGATHAGNDMGIVCADFDDDGDLDLYATNITDPSNPNRPKFNVLNVNQFNTTGQTQFVDVAEDRGVEDTAWGWGVEFTDVENDGDLDIVAVNGFDEFVLNAAGPTSPLYQTPSVLFINDGTGNFNRLLGAGLDDPMDSRALIAFDYDRDGDEDLLVTNVAQPARLFENASTAQGHWLDVALVQGSGANRNAIGATVRATMGATTKRREILCGDSYLAGTPLEAHFGLGGATTIDLLEIEWTDGTTSTFQDVAADRLLRISNVPGDCNADASQGSADVEGFIAVLLGEPNAPLCLTDFNNDGLSNAADIQDFVTCLLSGACP